MSRVIIHVKIYPTKECEFTQSIESLIKEFRKEKGCLNYHLKRENENKYCLESEWQSMDELESGKVWTSWKIIFEVTCSAFY
jgi:quinol monooxygenase YgiN